jgi:hypothetical protein
MSGRGVPEFQGQTTVLRKTVVWTILFRPADRIGPAPALAVATDREGDRALHGAGVATAAGPGQPGHSGKDALPVARPVGQPP